MADDSNEDKRYAIAIGVSMAVGIPLIIAVGFLIKSLMTDNAFGKSLAAFGERCGDNAFGRMLQAFGADEECPSRPQPQECPSRWDGWQGKISIGAIVIVGIEILLALGYLILHTDFATLISNVF